MPAFDRDHVFTSTSLLLFFVWCFVCVLVRVVFVSLSSVSFSPFPLASVFFFLHEVVGNRPYRLGAPSAACADRGEGVDFLQIARLSSEG